MKVAEFVAGDWIDRLARALPCLAELQERYLQGYRELTPRMYGAFGGRDGDRPAFPLDDLLTLYAEARHSNLFGEQEHYEPLLAVLGPRAIHGDCGMNQRSEHTVRRRSDEDG